MAANWLTLAYTLPPEPSRKRVAAWRRMRKLGAVYLNEGIWFLPRTDANEVALAEMVAEIQAEGGTGWAFRAEGLEKREEADLVRRFNAVREEEYAEVVGHCDRFLNHVQRDTEANNLAFAKIEEFEQDLEKRLRLLNQVRERDALGASGGEEAERKIQACRAALDAFTEAVFLHTRE